MSSTIQLVCFDLGGVLIPLSKGWQGACAKAGVTIGAEDPAAWAMHQELLNRFEIGALDEDAYIQSLPQCLPAVRIDDVLKAFDAWLLGLHPGVDELLKDLKKAGIQTAALSNTNARHWRTVFKDDPQYRPLFQLDRLFASHELGFAKPDGKIYRAVETATGLRPKQILFFDDLIQNVEAARAAGWNAEHIADTTLSIPQIRRDLTKHGLI